MAIAVLMAVSPDLLAVLGWPYNDPSASLAFKIHPALYLLGIAAIGALFSSNNAYWPSHVPASIWLLALVGVAVALLSFVITAYSGDTGGGEASSALVTFLTPALLIIALRSLTPREIDKASRVLRLFLIANSALAIAELATGWHLVPTTSIIDRWRATAFLGHPLHNATVTGAAIVYLFVSEVRRWSIGRTLELILHGVALLAFGGRAVALLVPVFLLMRVVAASFRRRNLTERGTLPRYYVNIGLMMLAGVAALPTPFMQSFLGRFVDDSGSAQTRMVALKLLHEIDANTLMFGASGTELNLLRIVNNSQFGIENAWISILLTRGLFVTALIGISFGWVLLSISKHCRVAGTYIALFFVATTLASLSVGSKTLIFAQILLLMVLFTWRAGGQSLARAGAN